MVWLIVLLNRVFRRPKVEGRESAEAYSEWEYRWGNSLVREYLEPAGDLKCKKVLDIGCGLGGKTVAYGEAGAAEIFGADLSIEHVKASHNFAAGRERSFEWGFVAADAALLPWATGMFDTVVANDAMEHFAEPEAAVREMARVTKAGGAVWLFFTPHYSPFGSHLYDYVYTPWCHLLFRRNHLGGAIHEILRSRNREAPADEIEKKLEGIMRSYDTELNHMSIRRFHRILRERPELEIIYVEYKPAKFSFLKLLTRLPLVRELFTGTVICRLKRVAD
ncbi:MAG: class I SAM-dependent methyltransferase [Candidatus Latescibacterota bacterium]|nr:MAG: class I SAM-dependent methyltransferase [Candidatus Latescibacterota bacterium]